jgi:hypothetical protein
MLSFYEKALLSDIKHKKSSVGIEVIETEVFCKR